MNTSDATPSAPAPNPYGFPPVTSLGEGPMGIDDAAVRFFPHVPADEDRVVLLLHGLGSTEDDLLTLAPMLPRGLVYASVRGVLRCGPGYAWLQPPPLDGTTPELLDASADALETWIAEVCPGPVIGAIGFSQGAMLALHLLRRNADALGWVAQLSGAPFPQEMPGDTDLAVRRPPAYWGHGGADPLFPAAVEGPIRSWMREHTTLTEVRSPMLAHGIDEEVLAGLTAFVGELTA